MVAEMLQKLTFLLFYIHVKFYFDYAFHIYVTYFVIFLLYIYMYITCFLFLLYVSIFTLFDFKFV